MNSSAVSPCEIVEVVMYNTLVTLLETSVETIYAYKQRVNVIIERITVITWLLKASYKPC